MTKRTHARCAAALGIALSLTAVPALAAGASSPLTPGFILFGQAGGAGAGTGGAGTGGAGTGGAGTGGAGTGGTAGTGTNGTGGTGAGGAGVGGTGVGAGATGNVGGTGNGTGSGVAAPGSATGVGNANGTGGTGTGNTGGTAGANGNTGTNGNNGTNGTNGTSGNNGTNGNNGTGGAQGSLPVPGASGGPQLFDLPATIRAAIQSSADVQTAARNVQIDRKRSDEAADAGRPNVDASGTAIRYDKATEIALGSGPPIQVTPTHQEILTLNVSNRFDLTGQIRAATDQARLQSLADEFILGQIRNARILRAQTIYFNTLRAQHQVDVAQAALNNAERQLQDATNLNAAGVGQRIDVLRAQTQVATAQQNLDTAQNNFAIALTSFNDLVGRPLPAPVRLVDPARRRHPAAGDGLLQRRCPGPKGPAAAADRPGRGAGDQH